MWARPFTPLMVRSFCEKAQTSPLYRTGSTRIVSPSAATARAAQGVGYCLPGPTWSVAACRQIGENNVAIVRKWRRVFMRQRILNHGRTTSSGGESAPKLVGDAVVAGTGGRLSASLGRRRSREFLMTA